MGSLCLLVVTSFLFAGTLRGQELIFSGCRWDNRHSLNCTSSGITVLGDLFSLQQEHRNVSSWTRSLRVLRSMKHINLSYNKMTSLHLNVLYKLSSLETLNISNNHIFSVSLYMKGEQEEKHTVLTSLQTLVIDRNRLTAIPKGLGKLKSLQTLCLSANRILQIQQDDFTNCTQLQKIDLGDNRINRIHPDAFRDLRNLQILRLSSNALVSIPSLVFLYSHVLRADIDLSDNMWACDCRILSLKRLISDTSLGARKAWNITCSTPIYRAGHHLLSIKHLNESCQTTVDKYVYARRLVITAGEKTYMRCDISEKLGINKAFWWTPRGIILDKSQVSSHYIDRINNLILAQPDNSDEGLYICVADVERIVYQVYVQTNEGKLLIRNPRDVQLLNSRMRTQEDFALAVSLSVILSFLVAFCLGVFLRPYIETLWKKQCKSKDLEGNNTAEACDNEGFTEVNVDIALGRTKNAQNRNKNNQVPTRSEIQGQGDYTNECFYEENPDFYDGATVNSNMFQTRRVTWTKRENVSPKVNLKHVMSLIKPIEIVAPEATLPEIVKSPTQNQVFPSNISTDVLKYPKTNREHAQNFSDDSSSNDGSNDFIGEENNSSVEDAIRKSDLLKTNLGTWTNDGNISPKVNLKHVMSLIKPIKIVAPDSTLTAIVKSPTQNQVFQSYISTDVLNYPKTNKEAGQNFSDDSSSNDGSNDFVGEENDSSDEDAIRKSEFVKTNLGTWTNDGNISPTVNLKHVMSLIKPITIIVPDSKMTDGPKSPKHNHLFLGNVPRHPDNSMENIDNRPRNNDPDTRVSEGESENQSQNTKFQNNYSDTLIRPKSNKDVGHSFYDDSSSNDGSNDFVGKEDHSSDEVAIRKSDLLQTKLGTWPSDENISPTVNLKHVMSLIKPITIIVPDSKMTDGPKSPKHNHLFLGNVPRHPDNRMENIDNRPRNNDPDTRESEGESENQSPNTKFQNNYSDTLIRPKPNKDVGHSFYDDSSSNDGSNDLDGEKDHSSDEDSIRKSDLLQTKLVTWTSDENISPQVNLKHVMSLIKPITIIAPDSTMIDVPKIPKRNHRFLSTVPRHPDNSMENIDNWPRNNDPDTRVSEIESENQSQNTNFQNHYSDTLIRPKPNKDVGHSFYDNSSSDDGSNDFVGEKDHSSDEDAIRKSDLLQTKLVTWPNDENISPKVNLKHVMSLIKPITIIAPDSTMTDVPKSPKYNYLFLGNVPRHPDNSMENIDNWPRNNDPDTRVSEGESENQSQNTNFQNHYSDTLIRPKPNKDVVHNFYDDSSSNDGSNDLDGEKDHSSDEDSIRKSDLLQTKLVTWTSDENISPKVNLKHVMSLIKPITIIAPDSTKTDVPKIPKRIHRFPSTVPRHPDNSMENLDNWHRNNDPDTRVSEEESENQLQNTNFQNHHSDTLIRPKPNKDIVHNFYDDSSSNDGSNDFVGEKDHSSDEDAIRKSDLLQTKLGTWTSDENISPKVNLKHVMSLIKPITIIAPDSTKTDVPKIPKRNHCFLSTVPRHPDNSMENIDNWPRNNDPDTRVSEEESENQSQNTNFQNHYSDTLIRPKPNKDVGHSFYDDSSSDDGSNDLDGEKDHSSDEDAIRKSDLLQTKLVTWPSDENISPKVNLKHVMSLIKPITIIAPDSTMTDVPKSPKYNHLFLGNVPRHPDNSMENIDNWPRNNNPDTRVSEGESENQSQNTNFQNHYSDTLIRPKPNKDVVHNFYDDSSSNDGSNDLDGEKDHSSDEDSIRKSDLLQTKLVTWTSDENISPKVNLKHVMSLIKPITIIAPDSTKTDVPKIPKRIHRFPSTVPRHPDNRMENLDNWPRNNDPDTRVSEGESENQSQNTNFQNHYSDTLIRPKPNKDIAQNVYDDSSSDDGSNDDFVGKEDHSSDEDAIRKSDLLQTKLVTWTSDENISPKVNLKHVMSLIKPITIIAPDSTKTDVPKIPKRIHRFLSTVPRHPDNSMENIDNWPRNNDPDTRVSEIESENQSQNTNFQNHYSDTLIRPKPNKDVGHNFYDDSSSNDGSNDLDGEKDHSSDEDSIRKSDLLQTKLVTWTSDENISPKVNLKHVMSLVKPITILDPDSTMTDVPKISKRNQLFLGTVPRHPDNRMENIDNWPRNNDPDTRVSEGESENQSQNTKFQNHYSDTLIRPKHNKDVGHSFYDNSSSDDGSNDFVGERDHRSDEDAIRKSDLLQTKLVTWTSDENISPKVNLKHVMSLIKPINIIAPDSTMTDVPKIPKRIHRFPSTVPRHPDNSMENIDNWPHNNDPDTRVSERESENQSQNTNFQNHYSETLIRPKHNKDVAQNLYDDSSSNDGSNDFVGKEDHSSDEDAIRKSDLLQTKLVTWTSDENISPKVNLKHVMSLIKPITIIAPDSTKTDVPKIPKRIHRFPSTVPRHPDSSMEYIDNWPHNNDPDTRVSERESENQSQNTNFQNHYSDNLIRPKPIKDIAQNLYDDSSSDDGSNDFVGKEDHSSDEDAIRKSDLLQTKLVTWTSDENISPKVNLKRVMSLVKPITILDPDSTMTDVPMIPKRNHLFLGNVPRHPDNRMENIDNWPRNNDLDTRLMEGQTENQLHNTKFQNHYTDTLSRPKPNKDSAQNVYEDSSSDDGSDDLVGEKDHSSDEDAIRKSDLLETKLVTWTSDENISPKVNLKHVMCLVKPIKIIVPDSTSITEKSSYQKQFFQTSISREPEDRLEIVDKYQHNHDEHIKLPTDNQENQLHSTHFTNHYSNTLKSPTRNVVNQTIYHRSSDEESNHFVYAKHPVSYEGDVGSSNLLDAKFIKWGNNEDDSFKVNLRHVISLVKPINIKSSDFTITDILKSPTQKQFFPHNNSGNRMENILSEDQFEKQLYNINHYSATIDSVKKNAENSQTSYDSSSDDGSFFSFSKSNSLSDDCEQIDFGSDEEGVMDIQSNSNKEIMYSGDISNRPGTPIFTLPTRQQAPKGSMFSGSQPPGDLYKQERITKPTVKTETLPISSSADNKAYFIPDFGETSTDGNFMNFDIYSNDSFKPQQVGKQRETSARVDVMPDNPGSYFLKKKKVFDAFSATLKPGQNFN